MLKGLQLQSLLLIVMVIGVIKADFKADLKHKMVDLINEKRINHLAQPVEFDDKNMYDTQAYAEDLAKYPINCSTTFPYHNDVNRWCGSGVSAKNVNPATVVNKWYDGIKYYNFDKPQLNDKNWNFVTMIWAASRRVSIGIATSPKGHTFVVAEFFPPSYADGHPARLKIHVLPEEEGSNLLGIIYDWFVQLFK